MSEHKVTTNWKMSKHPTNAKTYSRDHEWIFENGQVVEASAAPTFLGNPQCVDPEQAFVASIASCHMLTFLFLCSQKGYPVHRYHDVSVGTLEKNEMGKMSITKIKLCPEITFGEGAVPAREIIEELHTRAHQECFIANSVNTEIIVCWK
ncbi:MAG: OsmC family peroxiredoxin [Alphaproteobacteria bacterium]|jgi:organic hydroperoxide reductase OsmC/OhrA|nr:OsmC family peroxiredoxin [Alphaproteobacteria bacterium]MBT5389519.1 OsmC family peroxiredoxin [Alphaproteobacteria bacterium]MBT5539985.1 OsmC family peroxiredoxin [Alphaproteobacteria bacterium]MBT5654918.1 OsmC family peroxiredoxin [Alphaproteobacteria bacterium]